MIWHIIDQAAPQDRVTAGGLQDRVRRAAGEKADLIMADRHNSATHQNNLEKSCPSCPTREPIDQREVAA